jgi:hypothetical protein
MAEAKIGSAFDLLRRAGRKGAHANPPLSRGSRDRVSERDAFTSEAIESSAAGRMNGSSSVAAPAKTTTVAMSRMPAHTERFP